MNAEKMYCLDIFCCICMNKSDLNHLFDIDNNGVSHYNKLISSIAEMNFKEMKNQRLHICGECCVTLNTVNNFRQMCLRNKTNLINYISQLQTFSHVSGTVRVCLKDINPELIVRNRGETENEGSYCFEVSDPQIKLQTMSYKENNYFSASVKKECESEYNASSAHEDATVDHVNECAHSDVKVENVNNQTMMDDYLKYYTKFNKTVKEECESTDDDSSAQDTTVDHEVAEVNKVAHSYVKVEDVEHQTMMNDYSEYYTKFNKIERQLEKVKSDPETPYDGSTNQVDTGSYDEPKDSGETTIAIDLTQNIVKDNERLHQCEICQKSFNRKSSLANHMRSHYSKKSYECEICKKSYSYMSHLITHMVIHTNERSYKCDICNKGFKYKSCLTVHKKSYCSGKPYECEICKKGFNHNCIHTDPSEMSNECRICKKDFLNKWDLTVHMETHYSKKPYECEICKKRFEKKVSVFWHMKGHSNESS